MMVSVRAAGFRRRAYGRAMLLGAASLIGIGAAQAQQAGGSVPLDTIQVWGQGERADGPVGGYVPRRSRTATKTDTPIARTPQSIAVVPREQMQDQAVRTVAEALRYSPGVFTEYRGASNVRDEMFVRGFYYVPRYLDGLFLAGDLSYATVNPYLLERVELLSGPSSVLFGQANPGGLVNMVSKRPTATPLREVQFTAGTCREAGISFDFSDRFAGSETLSFRLAGTGFRRDQQERFTSQSGFAIAPSLRWTPDEQTRLTILAGYQYEPQLGFRNFLDADGTVRPIAGYGYVPRNFMVSDPDYERMRRTQAWIGYEFERALNDTITVRQNARYHEMSLHHQTLVWGYTSPNGTSGANTIVNRQASGGTETWRQFAVDNQLQARFQTGFATHTVLAGLDYRYRTRDYRWGRSWAVPTIDLENPVYGGFDYGSVVLNPSDDQRLTARQAGLYVQDQISIGRLDITLGARYDAASTDIVDRLGGPRQTYDDHAATWRAAALYRFDNGIAPYVSYSTSFEPSLYTPPTGQPAFRPTTARQFEAGVKYAPEGGAMLLTAAYYDLRQQNVVMGAWDPVAGATVYSQIGAVHNRGVELSARMKLFDDLSVVASYAYTHSRIEASTTAGEVGKMPARIPAHQASIWAKYEFSGGPLHGLGLGAGVRVVGESWGNNTNTFTVPSVALLDASITYDFGARNPALRGVSVQINAKNLTDRTFVASCASAYSCFYGAGRTVTASLRYTW